MESAEPVGWALEAFTSSDEVLDFRGPRFGSDASAASAAESDRGRVPRSAPSPAQENVTHVVFRD